MRKFTPLGRRRRQEKQVPFPGIIDGLPWEIQEGKAAFVQPGNPNLMQVPLGDTLIDRKIRLHEQAHVQWTPEIAFGDLPEGISPETLNAVEDSRIIKLLSDLSPEYREINTETYCFSEVDERKFRLGFKSGRIPTLEIGRLLISTIGYTGEHAFVESLAREQGLDWLVDMVRDMYWEYIGGEANPLFEDTLAFAKEFDDKLAHAAKEVEQENERRKNEDKELEEADLLFDDLDDEPYSSGSAWGTMEIVRPPLTEKLPPKLRGKKYIANDVGIIPRNWHRQLTDRRVFSRKTTRSVHGGSVLLDMSGSMELSIEDMQEIIRRWPGAIVAGYSGNGAHGQLRILARKGKMTKPEHLNPPDVYNTCDGPALDWLSRQKAPRIWISDGLVNGTHRRVDRGLLLDAARKVNAGNIQRIENVQELLRG